MPRTRAFFGRKTSFKVKLKKSVIYSITAILLFAIAGLIWLSFTKQGPLLSTLYSLLTTQFGVLTTFFLPFPFIVGGLMLTKIRSSLAEPHVFIGSFVVLAALAGLSRGGQLGNQLWQGSSSFLSPPGAGLFLLAGLSIGVIIMFNIPFEDVLAFFGKTFSRVRNFLSKFKKVSQAPTQRVIKFSGMATPPPFTPPSPASPAQLSHFRPPLPPSASETPWHFPPLSLLSENISGKADRGDTKTNAGTIEKTLDAFGITAKVSEINYGPAVTQYALEVAIGTKLSKISALSNDLALALAAPTGQIRIEAPIPGRSLVGIELPNRSPEFVSLRKMLESDPMKHHKSKLAVALGLDVSGNPIVADIAKMPHVLIAGATGSGKSVCINAFIGSLLFRTSPSEVNLIMVDPKRVELTNYNGIPHLLCPVIVEPAKVLSALKWATGEMDRRYKLFAEVGARNIDAYNELSGFQALPYIIIVIDELADIMLYAQVEVEDAITRIAQMARATGLHLVLATQRPSVDIITGLIKANIPTRIAFAVSSMIDSKVIIDQPGAEKLLGRGDMLYIPPDQAKPTRIQGAFVSDREIHQLIEFLKKQGVAPHYTEEVTSMSVGQKGRSFISPNGEDRDPLFEDAVRLILSANNASASFLQRKLSIGYARAARILDELQQAGIIGPAAGAKPRDILIKSLDQLGNENSRPNSADSP
ncbi:MAG: cell division FtsK/SpoIIIE [Candidatus Amesbacteria bacterium GW2011_GWB1_47_26]|uniref:Cell division FtsK/SpoIIIE n=1 Tax=Candidatus Amesbacteria bacterium GW2011_GWC2_45_19 TaxID=1618366 RepID=A0A0G1Q305_9BACT|nr:MAG: cell division FtsK/SpoIIIE [Candidatus Amesbacteria bacterium GW2011_GWC2_45_19]KKU38722.1 MAG: cell division FtsK/SpoIIIE [Candidatus Amesbacteria bacterium GW2011_GWA1_46_35]KKU69225.1 MAG: cell division FtsK/SpoIIIE [Microgenomates group bacterium GW2011_GWC1_47_20]KKU74484.1 MAG: cell division FtsK/SpoIIIE [Candidatus Amesbacteria bacterium GW2011_GWB1_47_26]KKU78971.1 MAG: cell division FtsK/SpoIIIE [Candidatus Amesbacteria bacterium GW2011_GWA2_47_70]